MNIFKSRKFRQGSIATVITVLGVVLVLVLNMVVSALSSRFQWRLDMTTNKVFEVSQESRDFLAGLSKDVNIYVLNSEDAFVSASPAQYMLQANEILKKYQALSPHVTLSYVDIVRTPAFVSKYSELSLRQNQILIEEAASGRRMLVNNTDLFNYQTDQNGQGQYTSSKAEQIMTSAILNVTSDKKIRVTVLGGHNEGDISGFTNLLASNNYEIVEQNLLTEQAVDPEATIAILAAPERDLTEDELRKLDTFLSNDNRLGKLLYYLTSGDKPDPDAFPNLSAFLSEWGIAVENDIVFEMNWNYRLSSTDPRVALVDYAGEEYSANLKEKNLYPAMLYAKPLSLVWETKSARTTKTLLQFSTQSGVLTEENTERIAFGNPSGADMTGPIPALVMSTELRYDNLTPLMSHVVACGSLYSFDQDFLGSLNYANSEYYLTLTDTLAGREDKIRIQDKTISVERFSLTANQFYAIGASVLIVFPLALLIFGIVIWLRRRHR